MTSPAVSDAMVEVAIDAWENVYEAELHIGSPTYTDNKEIAMRAALAAAIGAGGQAVAVKPLEWEGAGGTCIWANVPAWWLSYHVSLRVDRMHSLQLEWLGNRNNHLGVFATWDEAKAAAQADYERRILSALSQPHPADERVEEALRADIDEFMRRLGPQWFLEQGWFPATVNVTLSAKEVR